MADILILAEFLVTVIMAVVSDFYLKEKVITGTVLMVGILITMSTYIIKGHVINENKKQTEASREYLSRVRLWIEIEHSDDPDVRRIGSEIIRKADTRLQKIAQGTWEVQDRFELDTVIKECVQESRRAILVTHLNATKWKDCESFRELFEENERAVRRGVKIHRIFILWKDEMADPAVRKIVREHIRAGITVECVRSSDIPSERAKDFMIFDDSKVIVENMSPDFAEFTDGIVSKNCDLVEEWKKNFEGISTRATEDVDKFFQSYVTRGE